MIHNFVQATNKQNIKLFINCPLWGEPTDDRWIGGFSLQRVINANSVSIAWHYHGAQPQKSPWYSIAKRIYNLDYAENLCIISLIIFIQIYSIFDKYAHTYISMTGKRRALKWSDAKYTISVSVMFKQVELD